MNGPISINKILVQFAKILVQFAKKKVGGIVEKGNFQGDPVGHVSEDASYQKV